MSHKSTCSLFPLSVFSCVYTAYMGKYRKIIPTSFLVRVNPEWVELGEEDSLKEKDHIFLIKKERMAALEEASEEA